YSLDGGAYQASATFNNVAAGNHSVTVRSTTDNTCVSPQTPANLVATIPPAAPIVTTTDPTTCANPTGTITVTAPLGAGLSYSIDGVDYSNTTGIFNNVTPGTYNATVQNAAGCISTATVVTINGAPTAPPAPTITLVQPTCATPTG